MRILVADDSPSSRGFLEAVFQDEGIEVVSASDGMEALEILRSATVDAIISDILMPRMDGYRLCYEVRRDPYLKRIPIIIHSGTFILPKDEKLAEKFGADRFVRKSGSRQQLISALREVTGLDRGHVAVAMHQGAGLEVMKPYSARLIEKLEERNGELERTREVLTESNRQLLLSEEKFRGIFDHMQDVFFRADKHGIIQMISPSIERYGYARDELVGADLQTLCGQPDDWGRLVEKLMTEGMVSDFELSLKTKDCGVFVGSINAHVLSDTGVSVTGIEGFVRDITERQQAEHVLREAEEKYRRLFENSIEGILQIRPSGEIITANPAIARILGYESAEDLKASAPDIAHSCVNPTDWLEVLAMMEEHGSSMGKEIQLNRKDGPAIWALVRGRAVRDAGGVIVFYEGTVEDIGERKRLWA
ncbi:MAG TPA: PAS domain S-box protein [Blastocatellia bacterium]